MMEPERIKWVNGHKIEEFYWAGELVVYVDNKRTDKSFEDACNELFKGR